MEYSLQIDLAICLNTEYVWTRRTKKAIRYLCLMAFYYVCIQRLEPASGGSKFGDLGGSNKFGRNSPADCFVATAFLSSPFQRTKKSRKHCVFGTFYFL